MASPESSRLYSIITKHWARVATGLVALLGVLELLLGGITANSSFEVYLTAWAATTAGLWFLFEKAEVTSSDEVRDRVARSAMSGDLRTLLQAIPHHFATLFDRVFGHRHVSWRCFWRSSVASLASVSIMGLLWIVTHPPPNAVAALNALILIIVTGVVVNLLPDYLSLLETRLLIGRLEKGGSFVVFLAVDLIVTAALGLSVWAVLLAIFASSPAEAWSMMWGLITLRSVAARFEGGEATFTIPNGLFFYTTFFTSVWLWLYVVSVHASRTLLRMNDGVGFLLRSTDVDRQPFRSIGFVGVVLVSILFALGLPLVFFFGGP